MTDRITTDAPEKPARIAVIVLRPETEHLRVGGLSLRERWLRAMRANRLTAREVTEPEISGVLLNSGSSILLLDASAVIDDESIGKIVSIPCADEEIVVLQDMKATTAPVLLMGANAARAVQKVGDINWKDVGSTADILLRNAEFSVRKESVYRLRFFRVADGRSAGSATWGLLKHMRYRYGGLVAKLINRNVSMVITRAVLWTKITPNMMTTFAGLLALLSVYLLTIGDYFWALIATATMQVSSILDGTDGEIAKMKFQFSDFGKWYDSIWDEITDALFIAAVGYHCYLVHDFVYFLPMGVFAGSVSFVYATVNWHTKVKYGHGVYWWFDKVGTRALSEREPSLGKQWKTLFGRDAYILISVLLAAANILPVLVIVMSAVSVAIFSMLFVHIIVKRAKW